MQSASSIFWTIPPLLFPAEVSGGARGIINALGNLGGFIGPFVVGWMRTAFNSYDIGIYFLVAALMAGFFLTLSLPDKTTGKRDLENSNLANSNDERLGLWSFWIIYLDRVTENSLLNMCYSREYNELISKALFAERADRAFWISVE